MNTTKEFLEFLVNMGLGPTDYVIAKGLPPEKMRYLCYCLADIGLYTATIDGDTVLLPGKCVEGTETYMRGFMDAWYYLMNLKHEDENMEKSLET